MMNPARSLVGEGQQDESRSPSRTPPRAAKRWAGCGRGGRPDSAATTEIRATARAGHQAAATAVTKVRTMAAAMAHHGRAKRSMRCSAIDAASVRTRTTPASPTAVPTTAAVAPTAAPLASMTRRTCRSVAPMRAEHAQGPQAALGHDGESGHRQEPDEEQPERAEHEDDDLGAGLVAPCLASAMLRPRAAREGGTTADSAWLALTRTETLRGGLAWPGATSANWSSRSSGFSTRPTTCRRPACPRSRCSRCADRTSSPRRSVTATWSGPVG